MADLPGTLTAVCGCGPGAVIYTYRPGSIHETPGSALTIEGLRDGYVPTGWLRPNATRSVKGREFGLKRQREEKKAPIAFLKTL